MDDPSGDWIRIGGTVDQANGTVSTAISRFGIYALAEDLSIMTGDNGQLAVDCQPRVFSPNGGGYDIKTAISFSLGQPSHVTVRVYNLAGRLKRIVVENRSMNPGMNVVEWDGKDGNGHVVVSGLYIVTVQDDARFAKKTVSVLNR